jgi:hypothetical protein
MIWVHMAQGNNLPPFSSIFHLKVGNKVGNKKKGVKPKDLTP